MPILGKYTALDLNILHIAIKELTQELNKSPTRGVTKSTAKDHNTVHLSYSDIAKHLTPLSQASHRVSEIHYKLENGNRATQIIVDRHPAVFHGIGRHRYRQVELSVDKSVKPKVQPQYRIPFPKWRQFDTILQELEEEDIIEPAEEPTEWISNVVLTPKADSSQLHMNIDMTTANTVIKCTRHVIPTLEELQYELIGANHFSKLDIKQGLCSWSCTQSLDA